ncbi:ATP-binding protein [Bdellovibrio reynosensis]|uniref:histidine kinase n=1 Tax=Bdellovibrio reynosensis TaxID=2835041 RepID=A0ABY4CBX2_9BACT|nr:ATP-binding protein [Bdellovibrio reynosensis]UOF02343.1 ATP-binding protein [Bdellovibrio reynosensis]
MLFINSKLKLPDKFPLIFPGLTLLFSLLTMTGWVSHSPQLIQWTSDMGLMKFNTAMALALLSVTYFLKCSNTRILFHGLVLILALTTGLQIPLGIDVGIDTLFINPFTSDSSIYPGRMAASTVLCLTLLSLAGLFSGAGIVRQMLRLGFSSGVLGVSLICAFSYVFDYNPEYGWGSFGRISMQVAVCLFFLALANLWMIRGEVRRKSSKKLALFPGYVLWFGVIISVLIWQLLVLRDQERSREMIDHQAEQLKSNIDKTLIPIEKGLEHLARHVSNERDRTHWNSEALHFVKDFKGVVRVFFADKDSVIRWRYPDENNTPKNVNLNERHLALKEQIENIQNYKSAFITEVFARNTGEKISVLFVPVYRNNHYVGAVGATILTDIFFSHLYPANGYNFSILENNAVVFNQGTIESVFQREWQEQSEYRNFGANWTIMVVPSPAVLRQHLSALPMAVLVFGFSISILLAIALNFYYLSKEAEQKSRAAFEWTKAGMDSMPMLIIFTDEKTIIREINETALKILEYTAEELKGKKSFFTFLDPAEVKAFQDRMEKEKNVKLVIDTDAANYNPVLLETGFRHRYHKTTEWTFISKSGKRYNMVAAASEILDENGKTTGYLSVCEDVTLLREKERIVKEQERKILTSSRMASLGEMAAGIAHEINNPLTIMSGHLGMIRRLMNRKGIADQDIYQKVESMEIVIHRIAKIIRGMRSYVHDSDDAQSEITRIETLIEDTLVFCQDRFKSEGIDLSILIEPDLTLKIRPVQITQVLINLLNNASDALGEQEHKKISISAQRTVGGIEITVTDNGPGIPEDIRRKIMEPFFTTKEVGKGVGLGLSISQSIMQAHKGEFYLDEKHHETKFVLWFPDHESA